MTAVFDGISASGFFLGGAGNPIATREIDLHPAAWRARVASATTSLRHVTFIGGHGPRVPFKGRGHPGGLHIPPGRPPRPARSIARHQRGEPILYP